MPGSLRAEANHEDDRAFPDGRRHHTRVQHHRLLTNRDLQRHPVDVGKLQECHSQGHAADGVRRVTLGDGQPFQLQNDEIGLLVELVRH